MKRWGLFLAVMMGALWTLGSSYHSYENRALQQGIDRVKESSRSAVQSVDDSLHRLDVLSEQVGRMDWGSLSQSESLSRLCEMMKAEPNLHQIGYALDPAVTPDHQRFGLYCVRKNGRPEPELLDSSYDYTAQGVEMEWYHRAQREGEGWSEPYYDLPSKAMLAEHTIPLRTGGGSGDFAGVAFASYSLRTLADLVKNLDLGEGGYAFIMTRKGRLISHPNWSDVARGHTLQQLASTTQSAELQLISQWAQEPRGSGFSLSLVDPMTQEPSWAWCGELSETGWVMCTVTLAGSVLSSEKELAKRQLVIILTAILFAIVGLAMLLKAGPQRPRALWALSLTGTVLLCGAVSYSWYLIHEGHLGEAHAPAIISAAEIDRLIHDSLSRLKEVHHRSDLLVVPTGIHIRQLTSEDKTLHVTGIIWQSYRPEAGDGVPPSPPAKAEGAGRPQGTTLFAAARPEAPKEAAAEELPPGIGVTLPGALSVEMEELFRQEVDGEKVIGWSFRADLPEQFDAKDFPLDRGSIQIELAPRAFTKPVLLVPDLPAYDNIITSAMPGVASSIELPGWQLEESFFSDTTPAANSDFGLSQASLFRDVPALRFTLTTQRVFINPFITHVIPLIILLFLMFAVLMLSSRMEGLAERLGFNASALIGAYGTFFFIAVLQHVSLRDSVGRAQLVYFEWFYILVYVLLLLLSINALLFSTNTRLKFILFEDNLWPKLLYGPLTVGGVLAATCVWFY